MFESWILDANVSATKLATLENYLTKFTSMNNLYISIENWYFLGAFKVPFVIRLFSLDFIILHIPIKSLIKRTIYWLETLRLELDLASIEPRIEMKVWKQKIDLKAAQKLKIWFWKVKVRSLDNPERHWALVATFFLAQCYGCWFEQHFIRIYTFQQMNSLHNHEIFRNIIISSSKRFTCNIRNWNASGMNFDRGMDQRIFLHKGIIPSSTESINIK